ncbi:MAG: carbohydrate kinase, partial [Candidatus Zixiibacteriota bacterium]
RAAANTDVALAAERFAKNTARPVFVTTGRDGIWVSTPDGAAGQVPTIELAEPIDIVGAGDSATAALIVGMIAELPPMAAAEFANVVASITVQQCGTTGTASPRQILARWNEWTV